MPKFRKKPVVIEAREFTGKTALSVRDWCLGELRSTPSPDVECCNIHLLIPTLEGAMLACDGDWIIRGVKGEFYPCKPDIFEATYEAVSE